MAVSDYLAEDATDDQFKGEGETPLGIVHFPAFPDAEELRASALPNLKGALSGHAESLRNNAEQLDENALQLEQQIALLRAQATTMRARAERLDALSEQAAEEGHFGKPVHVDRMANKDTAESAIRDALMGEDTMEEGVLADKLGCTKKVLKEHLERLQRDKKVGSIKSAGRTVVAWLAPDGRGDAPTSAPTTGKGVSAPGAGSESRATGAPVFIHKTNRKGESTPGQAQKIKQRNENRRKMQEARTAQQEASAKKAAEDRDIGNKKKRERERAQGM